MRVTNEIPVVSTEINAVRDAAPPWTTTSAPSRTTPPTPTNPHSQYLSPHVFHGRNSLCSANGKIFLIIPLHKARVKKKNKSYVFFISLEKNITKCKIRAIVRDINTHIPNFRKFIIKLKNESFGGHANLYEFLFDILFDILFKYY